MIENELLRHRIAAFTRRSLPSGTISIAELQHVAVTAWLSSLEEEGTFCRWSLVLSAKEMPGRMRRRVTGHRAKGAPAKIRLGRRPREEKNQREDIFKTGHREIRP